MPAKLIHTAHAQPKVHWKVTIVKVSSSSGASRYVEHSIIGGGSSFEDRFPVTLNHFSKNLTWKMKPRGVPPFQHGRRASGIGTQRSLMMAILLFRYLDAERGVHERLSIFKSI